MTERPIRHAILQAPDGSLECVRLVPKFPGGTLRAYVGWARIHTCDEPPPSDAEWVDGEGFVVDEAKAAEAAEVARMAAMSNAELMACMMDALNAKVTDLQAQIDILSAKLNGA